MTKIYHCPNCGGELRFEPESQTCHCDYCQSQISLAELTKNNQKQPQLFREPPQHYYCPACGAEIFTKETTLATFCCYCHNPVIISDRLYDKREPDGIIPFQISRQEAINRFLDWRKGKWFTAKGFAAPKQLEKITGLYLPYWLSEGEVNVQLNAKASASHSWQNGNVRYTEVSEYQIVREGSISFQHIFHQALNHDEAKLLTCIQSFDYSQLKPFDMAYLAGFLAEQKDIEQNNIALSLDKELRQYSESLLMRTVQGYDRVYSCQYQIDLVNTDSRYVLLPVWLLSYPYHGRNYLFALNGQTGAVYGELPFSRGKFCGLFGTVFTAVSLLSFIIGGLL